MRSSERQGGWGHLSSVIPSILITCKPGGGEGGGGGGSGGGDSGGGGAKRTLSKP